MRLELIKSEILLGFAYSWCCKNDISSAFALLSVSSKLFVLCSLIVVKSVLYDYECLYEFNINVSFEK